MSVCKTFLDEAWESTFKEKAMGGVDSGITKFLFSFSY